MQLTKEFQFIQLAELIMCYAYSASTAANMLKLDIMLDYTLTHDISQNQLNFPSYF